MKLRHQGKFIISVDIGTSFIKCNIYDHNASVRGKCCRMLTTLYPGDGGAEIDPNHLWSQFVACVREALQDCGCHPSNVLAIGFCTQRSTFITWDKETGEHFHNFISWKDVRGSELCTEWNNSWTIKGLNYGSRILYSLTKNKRYLAGSIFKLKSRMVTPRLLWAIRNIPKLKQSVRENTVYFGGIETWLLWKLTNGQTLQSEISLASSTGMFDPFLTDWGWKILRLISVPVNILPPVSDTGHVFGFCQRNLFGHEFPISAIIGDQQAGTFGCCCFDIGSVKMTMGTGLFIDVNTGNKAHASIHGIYPLVGWKIKNELVYLAESSANDAGSTLLWAKSIGLFENVDETAAMAESVENTDGVYFVPAFSGLQAPINNDQACAMFIGLKENTNKNQMVRAILEALAFRAYQIYEVMLDEIENPPAVIKCTGGVSNNTFVCQLIADLADVPLEIILGEEVTSLGVAFIAGLSMGFWPDKVELSKLRPPGKLYVPRVQKQQRLLKEYARWKQAVERSLNWYT